MQFKNKNIRIKNKNMRCARQMWKRIFIMLTYTNMNIKKNMIRLWCKIVIKTNVERMEKIERFYFYLYPFGDIAQRNF
jgi:hypothetical protein